MNSSKSKPSFFQKIANGARMTMTSFVVLAENKKAIIFPLIGSIFMVLLVCLWLFLLYAKFGFEVLDRLTHEAFHQKLTKADNATLAYIIFITVFFFTLTVSFLGNIVKTITHVGLSNYISNKFAKKPATIMESLGLGLSKLWLAIKWACVAVVMQVIINQLKNRQGGFLFDLIASLLGALLQLGWFIISFFIVPVFTFEDLGLIESIKHSAQLMTKTFGKTVVAAISFSVISGLVGFCSFFVIGGIIWTLTFNAYAAIATGIMFVTIVSCIISTAEIIFKTAVYNFAMKKPTGPFAADVIKKSFGEK